MYPERKPFEGITAEEGRTLMLVALSTNSRHERRKGWDREQLLRAYDDLLSADIGGRIEELQDLKRRVWADQQRPLGVRTSLYDWERDQSLGRGSLGGL